MLSFGRIFHSIPNGSAEFLKGPVPEKTPFTSSCSLFNSAMSLKNEFEGPVDLLAQVLNGDISADKALANWPEMTKFSSRVVGNAYHQLWHYLADEDIRKREPEYEQAERVRLQNCMKELLNAGTS